MGIVSGMVILLLILSIVLYQVIHKALMNQFDASLLSAARMLIAAIEDERDLESHTRPENKQTGEQEKNKEEQGIDFEIDVQGIPEFSRVSGSGFYQLRQQDGQIIASSPSLEADRTVEVSEISERPEYHKVMLHHHRRGRSVCVWFIPKGGQSGISFESAKNEGRLLVMIVGRDATGLYEQFMFLRLLFTGASAAVVLLAIGVGSVIVKTALKPLNHLAGEIAAIQVNTLDHRIDLANLPSEMVPVVQKLNDLLERLKMSFERERCFTSDVAHELRTPLAGLRSILDVALSRQRDWLACQESMTDCLNIAVKMQELVEKLLILAKLDANQITLSEHTFSISQLIEDCWKPFAESARNHNIIFENQVSAEILLRTDKDYLVIALNNVLENAAIYTDTGGCIRVECQESGQHIKLTFSNTGCSLSPEQTAQVMDRFWRADASRSETGIHCGLGLALAGKIIRSLGGSIQVTSDNGIFRVTIYFVRTEENEK